MQVLQNSQRPEGSLQVESSRKTGVLVYKNSWLTLPVTSRRDVIFEALCHVATWIFHVATSKLHLSATSRRHFLKPSVTSRHGFFTSRRGILTSRRHFYTSRHHLVTYSATSRRDPAPRDVIWPCPLPRRDVGF